MVFEAAWHSKHCHMRNLCKSNKLKQNRVHLYIFYSILLRMNTCHQIRDKKIGDGYQNKLGSSHLPDQRYPFVGGPQRELVVVAVENNTQAVRLEGSWVLLQVFGTVDARSRIGQRGQGVAESHRRLLLTLSSLNWQGDNCCSLF